MKDVKAIAHVCNDPGGWGKGFVLALSRRRPEPEAAYRAWHRGRATNDFGLGAVVRFVQVEPCVRVADMIGRRGTRTGSKGAPVRYEAIDTAVDTVAERAGEVDAAVHMPRIGRGLAGGKWSRVEALVEERLIRRGTQVTVYTTGSDRPRLSPGRPCRTPAPDSH